MIHISRKLFLLFELPEHSKLRCVRASRPAIRHTGYDQGPTLLALEPEPPSPVFEKAMETLKALADITKVRVLADA